MEPQATTTTTTQEKPMGLSDALSRRGTAPAVKEEPATTTPAAVTPAAPTEPAATAAPAPQAAVPPVVPAAEPAAPKDPVRGAVKAAQAERQKRQQVERELAELRARYEGEGQPEPTAPAVDPEQVKNQILAISEESARQAHSDYQEKFEAFCEAAYDANGNPTPLYLDVMERSNHPGEAAYQAGKTLLLHKKYGADPDAMIKAVREEATKELREQIRAEEEAKLKGKLLQRQNTPTDILAGGTAGAGGPERSAPLGFAQVLARRRR